MISHTVVFVVLTSFIASGQECNPVNFGLDSIVCACNSTYCDFYPDPQTPNVGDFVWYVTSKEGKRLQRNDGKISDSAENNATITINSNNRYQTIEGFGGAFTDAAGINIKSLSEGSQINLMRSYFSSDGSNYNLGRVPIAGTDFSTRPYTYDDVTGDMELANFSLAMEDYQYKMPLMRWALTLNPKLRFSTTAWTAPPWMKEYKHYNNFDYLVERYYQTYADYIVMFLQEYKKNGFDMWTLSTGNEPFTPLMPNTNINSMYWSPFTTGKWVEENLGPSLEKAGFNKTEIIMYDDQRLALSLYTSSVMNNFPRALKYIKGIALHWYTDFIVPVITLDYTHNLLPDKYILITESCLAYLPQDNPKVALGSWARADKFVKKIFENLNHWVVGWLDWNLALNQMGGPNWVKNYVDASVIVDAEKDVFYKQPTYYVFSHFSKFVPRNSVRIASASSDTNILNIAFQTENNDTVVLLYNKMEDPKNVSIVDGSIGNMNLELPGHSVHTILYRRS